jgi:hypothetical protein
MDKNIVDWRWIPRYYKKVDDKTSHVDVVYWYFGLETVFIVSSNVSHFLALELSVISITFPAKFSIAL